MNIVKLLQREGFGSRKQVTSLIDQRLVAIDEALVTSHDLIWQIGKNFHLSIAGDRIEPAKQVYVAMHKPIGYETSHRPSHHPGVFSLLPHYLVGRGVQAAGRLDADTTGLLLLSDDGGFIHKLANGKKHVPKIYAVDTRHPIDDGLLKRLLDGVLLHGEDQAVHAQTCQQTGTHSFRMTITAGKYHQVKRMVAAASNRVERLHRVAVGNYTLPADLAPGKWRYLDERTALGIIQS
ncbi:MAG: 16S rRNA pseudouridine(516) synthase [Burkholderiaceae bacterium]